LPTHSGTQAAQVISFAAAGIEDHLFSLSRQAGQDHLGNPVREKLVVASVEEVPPSRDHFFAVAGVLGAPTLRQQQVDKSLPCDVERVSFHALECAVVAGQWIPAYRAGKHRLIQVRDQVVPLARHVARFSHPLIPDPCAW